MRTEDFDVDDFAFRRRADALEALRLCTNAGIEAVLLVRCDNETEWEEATSEDIECEHDEGVVWSISDGGDNAYLVPKVVWDANEDLDDVDAPAPEGFLWVVP